METIPHSECIVKPIVYMHKVSNVEKGLNGAKL